ncbi:hypothetical protein OC842_005721 [Tilletia horrida]|uniref:Mediator of RNA polymerase II transcription subunit 13 n=1 Tax=Tilletia horrida TaxID=155126 RepID=A0AAN6G9U6_9BASI|nr:hypothetical protein OC842_005721 [Tilletia horrida]
MPPATPVLSIQPGFSGTASTSGAASHGPSTGASSGAAAAAAVSLPPPGDQQQRGRRSTQARLPHALSHTSHTITNTARLSWSPSPRRESSPNPSHSGFPGVSPAASQTLHTPAASTSTPKAGHGFSPQTASHGAQSIHAIGFSWKRFELRPVADTDSTVPSTSEHASTAARASCARKASTLRSLLMRCSHLEAQRRPFTALEDSEGDRDTVEPAGVERQALTAGELLRNRLLYAFETREELHAFASGNAQAPGEGEAQHLTPAAAPKANRKRKRDLSTGREPHPAATAPPSGTKSSGESPSVANNLTRPLTAVWIFEALPISQLRSSQTKPKDIKGKGKAREVDEPDFQNPLGSMPGDELILAVQKDIAEHLSTSFVLQSSGTLNPASHSLYPAMRMDLLANPALLQPSRKNRRTHDMLVRALRERLVVDFIHAHGWDGGPIPTQGTSSDSTDQHERVENGDQLPAAPDTDQNLVEKTIEALGGTLSRPRSGTVQSSSEEGEIPELEEGEHIEDGEIQEDHDAAAQQEEEEMGEDSPPELSRTRMAVKLPAKHHGLPGTPTFPVRFGSFVLMVPSPEVRSRKRRLGWSGSSETSILCVRIQANVNPEALTLSANPLRLWLTQLSDDVPCETIESLDATGATYSESQASIHSQRRLRVRAGDRIHLAPFGLVDEWRERRWTRCCMPAPQNVFADHDSPIEEQMLADSGDQQFDFVGVLSTSLNALISGPEPSIPHSVGAGAEVKRSLVQDSSEESESDDSQGSEHKASDGAQSGSGWWIPEPLRQRLREDGIDLRMLGKEPKWAVVRPAHSAACAPSPLQDSPGGPTIKEVAEVTLTTTVAEPDATIADQGQATTDMNTPNGSHPTSLPQDGRLEVAAHFGKGAFLWPLSLCFLLPPSFSAASSKEDEDGVGSESRLLPFTHPRGAPIYLPNKALTYANIGDVLGQAVQVAKDQQDENGTNQIVTAPKPSLLASVSWKSSAQTSKQGRMGHDEAENLAAVQNGQENQDLEQELRYGLPTHKLFARHRPVSQFLSDANPQPSTDPIPATTTSIPPAATTADDMWGAVLGVSDAVAVKPVDANPVSTAHRPSDNRASQQQVESNTGRARDLDGFDAMDLVTEDDFSFFDNVANFDFGDLGGSGDLGGEVLSLPGSAPPLLDSVNFAPEATMTMGHLVGNELATASDHQTLMMTDTVHQPVQTLAPTIGPISTDTGPSQTTTDYPSLPGFTPSSLSASSPAFGLNGHATGKTPRTPYSPLDEITDHSISVHAGNGYPSLKHHLASISRPSISGMEMEQYGHPASTNAVTAAISGAVSGPGQDLDKVKYEDPEYLHNKYDSGKFAIPTAEPQVKATGEPAAKNGASAQTAALPRTPTRQRFRFITRRGLAKGPAHGTPSKQRVSEDILLAGARPGSLTLARSHLRNSGRADEEYSEVGTMETYSDSDSSSDSADDSDGEDEIDLGSQQAKAILGQLLSGAVSAFEAFFTGNSETPGQQELPRPAVVGAPKSSAFEPDAKMDELWRRTVLECISMNPPLRAQALAEQSDSLTLPSVSAQETASILERFSAALVGPDQDLSNLLLRNLVEPQTLPDSHVELPPGLPPLGGAPVDSGSSVDVLEPPYIMTGCQGYVTRLAPTALKFWDKLGLSAVGGPKHVAPFILQLDASEFLLSSAVKWLERINSVFQTYGLGTHTPNSHSILRLSDGRAIDIAEVLGAMAIDDMQQERWEDTMRSILDTVKSYAKDASHVIIYIVGTPAWPVRWQGLTRMREDLSAMARQRFGAQGWQLQLRGVPQMMIFESGASPLGAGHRLAFDLKRFAFAIYDSLQRAVPNAKGKTSAVDSHGSADGLDLVHYPAFTLAPLFQRHMMDIALRWPLTSRDVIDRGLLLHVGYELRAARDCVVVNIMDQRGQSFFTDAWKTKDNLVEDLVMIWLKAVQFARRSSVVWRIVLCKTSSMSMDEVLAWSSLDRCGMLRGPGILDVTLGCVDTDSPLSFLPTADAPSGLSTAPSAPGAVMLDSSRFAFALYPSHRVLVPAPVYRSRYNTAASYLNSSSATSSSTSSSSPRSQLHDNSNTILALASSATIRVPLRTDYSTPSPGTFSTHVFSVPAQRSSPHTLWFHILQVYAQDIPTPHPTDAVRFSRDMHSGHAHYAAKFGAGGSGAASASAVPAELDPFLSAQAALHGRSSIKAHSHFTSRLRHGSPLSSDTPQSTSGLADYPTVSSTGGGMYAGSPSLTTSGAAHAASASAAAAAAARMALNTRLRDITQSMHELQLLSTERYSLAEPACFLPAHLGLLAVSAPGLASYTPMVPPSHSDVEE